MAIQREVIAQVLAAVRRDLEQTEDADYLLTNFASASEALSYFDEQAEVLEAGGDVDAIAAMFLPAAWLQDVARRVGRMSG